jgi:hypothetical protein
MIGRRAHLAPLNLVLSLLAVAAGAAAVVVVALLAVHALD